MKKIAVLLPYKDNFTNSNAGSASIWVKDFNKTSIYKNQICVFGNTIFFKDLIDKNLYRNLNLNKRTFGSKNASYVKEFLNVSLREKFELIEIHNRPSYAHQILKESIREKIVLIFHNNPLTLGGSKSLDERKILIERCKKIVFVSNWVKEKFFEGFVKKNHQKCLVIYPSVNPIKFIPKKENLISFVGKLNRSKGFNIFGNAVIKILKKYKSWNAIIVGDEPREKYNFKHKNLKYKGWISHDKTLNLYNKTSISVVPSLWEEPFGRTAMEAASRGCATIISKRGGLIETVSDTIFLTKHNVDELYVKIENLIKNVKYRKKIQSLSIKNVLHKLSENTKKIDKQRNEIIKDSVFSISKKKNLKILHISNFGSRLSNRLYFISIARKLSNGFIRNGHDVVNLSDRDIIKFNRYVSGKSGVKQLNQLFYESVQNYNPDIILFGHSDNINLETLDKVKNLNKNLKIAQWFEDNLAMDGPDPQSNQRRLLQYEPLIDYNFITTHPSALSFINGKKNYYYMPIPADRNIEKLNIYENSKPIYDLFFTMSHGVNRGVLKSNKKDERDPFIEKLIEKNPNIIFDIFGYKSRQPVWSEDFYQSINQSKMGLNLSRINNIKYYTSNRISSLVANGLMTFVDKKTKLNDFFDDDEVVFYSGIKELSDQLNYYKNNIKLRKKIAKNGQSKYFNLFDSKIVSKYLIDKIVGNDKSSYKLKWMNK